MLLYYILQLERFLIVVFVCVSLNYLINLCSEFFFLPKTSVAKYEQKREKMFEVRNLSCTQTQFQKVTVMGIHCHCSVAHKSVTTLLS